MGILDRISKSGKKVAVAEEKAAGKAAGKASGKAEQVAAKEATAAAKAAKKLKKLGKGLVGARGKKASEAIKQLEELARAKIRKGSRKAGKASKQLLPSEGKVGTYKDLVKSGSRGDNLTPHHMPSAEYMKSKGVAKNDGVSMNMEQPSPGVGGRHRETRSYGSGSDLTEAPRDALARDIMDARKIYQKDGLYTPEIRQSLQDAIKMNKKLYPNLF